MKAVQSALANGAGFREAARLAGCSPAKVSAIRAEMITAGQLASTVRARITHPNQPPACRSGGVHVVGVG